MHYRPQQNYYPSNDYVYDGLNPYYGSISTSNIGVTGGGNVGANVFPRTPRLTSNFGHRRNNSNTCNSSSINSSFRIDDEDYNYQITQQNLNYHGRALEYSPLVVRHDSYSGSRQNSSDADRPLTLEMNTKLRSSMKKYGSNRGNSPKISSNNSSSSGAGTPTNPTPPDSLTSEDFSYASGKEGSVSRVRFSPIAALMCESNPQREGILDLGHYEESSLPVQSRRSRKSSANELEKDFTS